MVQKLDKSIPKQLVEQYVFLNSEFLEVLGDELTLNPFSIIEFIAQ